MKGFLYEFAEAKLNEESYCDDYKEFMELTILFLGRNIQHFPLRNLERSIMLEKVVYHLEMWMFQDLTKKENWLLE